MNALEVPFLKRAIASVAAFAVIAVANVLLRLPNALLALKFGAAAALVRVVAGEGPAFRAAEDLRFIFAGGGEAAAIVRRIVTEARYADLAGIVEGAVARSLPWA